jgi:hypothetical protein
MSNYAVQLNYRRDAERKRAYREIIVTAADHNDAVQAAVDKLYETDRYAYDAHYTSVTELVN